MQRDPTDATAGRSVAAAPWTAGALAGTLLLVALSGCVTEVPPHDVPSTSPSEPQWFEVWITDAGIDLDALHLSIAKVVVSESQLTVKRSELDLLEHQGVREGVLLASGSIQATAKPRVQIYFGSAKATVAGTVHDLAIPLERLIIEPKSNASAAAQGTAFLVDIDAAKSVIFNGSALEFVPSVKATYLSDLSRPSAPSADVPPFEVRPVLFEQYRTVADETLPNAVQEARQNLSEPFQGMDDLPALEDLRDEAKQGFADLPGMQVDPDVRGWFVGFYDEVAHDVRVITVESYDANVGFMFSSIPAAYVLARDDQAWQLSQDPSIRYVSPDTTVEYHLASSRTAIRMPEVANPVTGLKDSQGRPVDGRGVGVAVVDVGFDGSHPDLPHHTLSASPALVRNYKVVYEHEVMMWKDVPVTDEGSGHGTHVAGILAGRGISDTTGQSKGIAPKASIYGFATGQADTVLWHYQALDWIAENHAKVEPPIRIVSNSWSVAKKGSAEPTLVDLVNQLTSKNVLVVFSAGNLGGNGAFTTTSGECRLPNPGVVCVGAYDDFNDGRRNGNVWSSSSRGDKAQPATWPDLTAPGVSVRAPAPLVGYATLVAPADYSTVSGTSMAAPHVAGVAALMLQAKPSLTNQQMETILKATAHKYAGDGSYTVDGHYSKGHGLVDAYAAVWAAKLV